MSDGGYSGFPQEGLKFFSDLKKNNNREWFQEHKQDYIDYVQTPAQAFVEYLGAELRTFLPAIRYDSHPHRGSILRIYRDIRFSKDKTPYKTHIGIHFWEGKGKKTELPGVYFYMRPEGAKLYVGLYQFPKLILLAYRNAVADDRSGGELTDILSRVRSSGKYEIGGEHYKRVPRGFSPDNARADLLRHNGLYGASALIEPQEICSPKLIDLCVRNSKDMALIHHWLMKIQ